MNMFWDKKKDDGLPDLPPMPVQRQQFAPVYQESEDVEAHSLPSFPDSPIERGFSQSAIKEAVTTEEVQTTEEYSQPSYATIETPQEEMISAPPEEYVEQPVYQGLRTPSNSLRTKTNDVYVKVDRFVSARKALEHTQNKLDEINELLKAIRETKMREEQELAYLEKEMATAKAKVQEITDNIFEKV